MRWLNLNSKSLDFHSKAYFILAMNKRSTKKRIPLAMAMMHGADPGLAKDQEIARLKAEIKGLRKAGDSVVLLFCAETTEKHRQDCVKAWLAAKEVQS